MHMLLLILHYVHFLIILNFCFQCRTFTFNGEFLQCFVVGSEYFLNHRIFEPEKHI